MSYLSKVSYTGDGVTKNYSIPFSYLEEEHVKVYLDNIITTAYTFNTPNTLQFNTAPSNGVVIRIERQTPRDSRLVDFQSASITNDEDFNRDSNQMFYLTQEFLDNTKLDDILVNVAKTTQDAIATAADRASANSSAQLAEDWAAIASVQSQSYKSLKTDFGAVGDGVADDTVAIQNAINAIQASGHMLFVPAGTYKVSNSIEICERVTVLGSGTSTRFHTVNTSGAPVFHIYNKNNHPNGLNGINFGRCMITGVTGSGDGLLIENTSRSRYEQIYVPLIGGAGIHCKAVLVSQFDTINVSTNLRTSFNLGWDLPNPAKGIVLEDNDSGDCDCLANVFVNPTIEVSGGVGVDLFDLASGNVFLGGTIEGNAIGMRLAPGVTRTHVISVDFESNGQDWSDSSTAQSTVYFGNDVAKIGKTVIGTDGSVTFGSGTKVKNVLSGQFGWNSVPGVGAMGSQYTTFGVTGAKVGDQVLISCQTALPTGFMCTGQVVADNTISIVLFNATGTGQGLGDRVFNVLVLQHTA